MPQADCEILGNLQSDWINSGAVATFVEVRVGLRPVSADDAPVLGALPGWANAFVCTGHGANGLLLGPYSARLVADLVLGRTPPTDINAFGPERF